MVTRMVSALPVVEARGLCWFQGWAAWVVGMAALAVICRLSECEDFLERRARIGDMVYAWLRVPRFICDGIWLICGDGGDCNIVERENNARILGVRAGVTGPVAVTI
jgi:hypothetical protein